eukprot:TRINITY_DN5137_c0_g1_i1.p1 TRINITY_DN5137_c0_g1~~TRINITY_DN5137_c0_g1_i1.p1  ORF type:complete len:241 (-),score=40.85 TRINITY_DN5137_c0_g1_i1:77-799(-)
MAGMNAHVFFDMAIGRRAVGRIKFELFHDKLPFTSENFRSLCTGETGLGYWLRPRWYRDTKMHRITPGFMCQGGDFNFGNGLMGESIYGQNFRDEKFCYSHSKRGVLSMANVGKRHTNNSQYFITFAPCTWLDGKHVVFGQVIDGFNVLDAIEAVGTEGGKPKMRVWVHNCGEESRELLRQEALEATSDDPAERARAALEAVADTTAQIERPLLLPHINEVSPVPDEVWKKAKAYRDNML